VLRAQAFEGLFTLVPVLLFVVVSIVLRARASRKRKRREEAPGGAPARKVPAARFTAQQPRRPRVSSRESYAYPPPLALEEDGLSEAAETRRRGPALPQPVVRPSAESRMAIERLAARPQERSLRERMAARGEADLTPAGEGAGKRSSFSTRLERLPPLKRAIVWAEILGPPGGRQ
jgi:hypothetical protein